MERGGGNMAASSPSSSNIVKRSEDLLQGKLSIICKGSNAQMSFREQLQSNYGLGLPFLLHENSHKHPLEPKHKIFLSHSGSQKSFVKQLCKDIERYDRYPFFDILRESLSIGCHFPNEIFKAIHQCHVAVVVLSEEFFSRTKWPMLELAALVKRQACDPNLIIMPVFLGITRDQCREKGNQDRWLGLWQSWCEKDKRVNIKEWEAVFKVFGYINSVSLRSDDVTCRDEIVEAVCKEVQPETRPDDSHVQGRSRLCKIIREKIHNMELSQSFKVQVLGLHGVGGIGKSTICMALCNDYFKEFHGKVCHVELGDGNELHILQEVLKRLTDTKHEFIEKLNTDECKDRLKRTIKNQRVFLAIDNVSESHGIVAQAKELLKVGFMHGSIVVVTARGQGELKNLNIHESECIEMPELVEDEAMSLFLSHAIPNLHFDNNDIINDQLVRQCIKQCHFCKGNGTEYHYHPLALEVLGEQLGNDPNEWLEKLKEIDVFNQYREDDKKHPIFSILRRSFDILKDEDKLLFMDVTLFYNQGSTGVGGKGYDYMFQWLSMVHGRSVEIIKSQLNALKRKSLIQNLEGGRTAVGIHDLWKEFCKNETKAGDLNSRRWVHELVHVLDDPRKEESSLYGGGWKNLQRIGLRAMTLLRHKYNMNLKLNCCSNLTVLELVGVPMENDTLDLSGVYNLKSLGIFTFYGLKVLGLGLLRQLVVLEWEGIPSNSPCMKEIGGLTKLQVLTLISHSHRGSTTKLPNLTRLTLLQRATFGGLNEATFISCSSTMTNLQYLTLSDCGTLKSCIGVNDLVALEELHITKCPNLGKFPNFQQLINLQKLNISECGSIKALSGIGDLVALLEFRAVGCTNLTELPDMSKLTNLEVLDLRRCPLNKRVLGFSACINLYKLNISINGLGDSDDLGTLTKLWNVGIEGWSPQGSPGVANLANLEHLRIDNSRCVDELLGLSKLTSLRKIEIWDCEFKDVSCLCNLIGLQEVTIINCNLLEKFPDMHKVTGLESVLIRDCQNFKEWGNVSETRSGSSKTIHGVLPKLQHLTLMDLPITELPDLDHFPQLKYLIISNCLSLRSLTCSAPLTALHSLSLYNCKGLTAMQLNFSGSKHLMRVAVENCGVELSSHEIEELNTMIGMGFSYIR